MKKCPVLKIILAICITLSFLAYFSAVWCFEKYGDIGFDAILFTMFSDLNGVSNDLVLSYIKQVSKGLIFTLPLLLFVLLFNNRKSILLKIKNLKITLYPFNKILLSVISVFLCVSLLSGAVETVGADIWIERMKDSSKIYEEEYIAPQDAAITFPDLKRNLIYIWMESMETTFFSRELGGGLKENAIPELYDLAKNETNFSSGTDVGGMNVVYGATWTIGAMVAQTAGIPMVLPVGGNNMDSYSSFLPGAYTINDILKENGYYQSFLCGSNGDFGGRKNYLTQHGVDEVLDYQSASEDGIIPKDYFDGWWGMEDFHLYEYAKQHLLELAKQDQPFATFMLTVDTHHIDGHLCQLCERNHSEQYIDVYNCASRQLYAFVDWIRTQDFYENTTIVIVGDHCSMDAAFMSRNVDDPNYVRQIYNCFINPAVSAPNPKNRTCTQLDLMPTTLAALGCTIENDRLALGVNLFSQEKTLPEKYGFDQFIQEITKKSKYYDNYLLRPYDQIANPT